MRFTEPSLFAFVQIQPTVIYLRATMFVPEAEKWYLQDQIGYDDKPTADFVGVNIDRWPWHRLELNQQRNSIRPRLL